MKYLNRHNIIVEGFFDFLKKPGDLEIKKRKIVSIVKECLTRGMKLENFTNEAGDVIKQAGVYKVNNRVYITINDDLSVNFNGNVYFREFVGNIPFNFYEVEGSFKMIYSRNINISYLPNKVGSDLDISENDIDSLEGLNTDYVVGDFNCSDNNLKTLENLPKVIGGRILADGNDIYTYKGIEFKNLKNLHVYLNPVNTIFNLLYHLQNSEDIYDMFIEFDPIRPGDKPGDKPIIVLDRFEEFFDIFPNPKKARESIGLKNAENKYDLI